ncbi:transketolase [Ordospora colligata]|uniref:transketolase n=1 Tax=Ordospora colligata OC4 TaxID=1354746 RepID=A0A0B2UEJ1_9MICR|nr:transketolase [Ordospora colligata OC4]KHN69511.1 transketolase [Ordospora colligata OC4]TBU15331.1 transketolase [Ordospora colligata]TBU15431.1 transketolase [Ordospora colligata]TBU18527.1 transketolase [Ordospora colligata]
MADSSNVNNIRCLCADMVQKANSGHPGAPLGLAPLAYILYTEVLNFDPDDEGWIGRDIFILSNGHACALQYVMNYLIGRLTIDDLRAFRQLGSRTPGHPERGLPGIECTTGPLGQGLANAVGYAISLKKLSSHIGNTCKVYCVFGDGCYQEGIGQESFSLAANLRLDNLVLIYDFNKVTIDGPTSLSMNENVVKRFESLGFVVEVVSGNDMNGMKRALKDITHGMPKVIILETVIGYGSEMEGDCKVHGSPLGVEGVSKLKERLGMPSADFFVSSSLLDKFDELIKKKRAEVIEWNSKSEAINKLCDRVMDVSDEKLMYKSVYVRNDAQKATRKHFSEALCDLKDNSYLIGGSADLQSSVLTRIGSNDFSHANRDGNYINFGIREHSMCGVMNGISSHGYFLPYSGTFLNFISYGFPSVRLACMDNLNLFYVLTHDSIGLGEDGPTHQPIEVLATLRATPGLITMRPCDGLECRASLMICLSRPGPKAVILSRQNVPEIADTSFEKAEKGAYFLVEKDEPDLILLSTGSEILICYEIMKKLSHIRISIVSFFSWELFELQNDDYKRHILKDVPRISIEAMSTFGWTKYADMQIGLDCFGASGKYKNVYEHFGLDCNAICNKIVKFLNK